VTALSYVAAGTVEEATDLLWSSGGDARPVAGGTALVPLLRQRLVEPTLLVGLAGIRELHGVVAGSSTIDIGAMTTLRDVECDPLVRRAIPPLPEAIRRVASVRVRNQATLGGNIAHADPALDPPPMLMALDAEVVIRGPAGQRQLPLDRFYVDLFETALDPGELVTRVVVPTPAARSRFTFVKFLPRTVDDFATVSVAVRLDPAADGTVGDVRIALGAAGHVPFRAVTAEAALRGQRPDPDTIAGAAELARDASSPMPDVRGSTAYKREMVRVWVARALAGLVSSPAHA
jgi:carbon-monoxide dehydrogenase medium subunit